MSFAAAVVLAVGVLAGMFALLFGLAFVERRLFDDVMVDPVDTIVSAGLTASGDTLPPAAHSAGDELGRAA